MVDEGACAPPSPLPPTCGNGLADPGEECDDGSGPRLNMTDSPGCDEACQVVPGWTCSDLTCDCNNMAGTWADPGDGLCTPYACPFQSRCPGGGTECETGAIGDLCAECDEGW